MQKVICSIGMLLLVAILSEGVCHSAERAGTVTFTIKVAALPNAETVKLWFPYPTSDLDQTIENLRFHGNYSNFTLAREPRSGAIYLYTEWNGFMENRTLFVTFHARAKERKVAKFIENSKIFPPEVQKYITSDFWLPSNDPKIKSLARQITRNKKGVLAKARAVYDWVVENTRQDPNVPGCGTGNVEQVLARRTGKCADISSIFVVLARASGVPSREVFGLRLGSPGKTDITDGHHCWAEFYLPGTGWVPVDPADVRKIMLEKKLDLIAAEPYREYYFGAVDEYRIALQKGGRGLEFSEGNKEKVNYFMYPYAEVDGKPLDYCRPKTFSFAVSFQEG